MHYVRVACVLALLESAGTAEARECKETGRVLPADRATNVPRNARVWIFGAAPAGYLLVDGPTERVLGTSYWGSPGIVEIDPGMLAPNRLYTVKTMTGDHVTTFTTGDTVDKTPPQPPLLERVQLAAGRLSLAATPAPETVAIWVQVHRHNDERQRAWQIFPANEFAESFESCSQFDKYAPDSECVELDSVDLAGNVSKIVSNCTPVIGNSWLLAGIDHPDSEGDRRRGIVLVAVAVLAGIGLVAFRGRSRVRRVPSPADPSLARARMITRRGRQR